MTTLMIRNLPPHATQQRLIKELNDCGFEGMYDFLYIPQCFHSNLNKKGFAFVNFTEPSAAGRLIGLWHRQRRFGMSQGQAALNIAPADLQGFEANLKKWMTPRLHRIKNPNLRPFIMEKGSKVLQSLALSDSVTIYQ